MNPRRKLLKARNRHDREAQRKCVSSGDLCSPDEMVRFVLDPDGVVTPDIAGKLPGRGAWIKADREKVETAARKGIFSRAFKTPAHLPGEMSPEAFAENLGAYLKARALDSLGLARRAGDLVAGFEKVKAALESGRVNILVCASDASEQVVEKLVRSGKEVSTLRLFSTEDLSAALGRDGVTYAAVFGGGGADRLLREARRFAGFAGGGVEERKLEDVA